MKKINCLVVDDDPSSLEILADYIGRIHFLQLVQCCDDPFEARDVLEKEEIDLLFLDIKLPGISGFDLLSSLKFRPAVIFTTGFKEFALESYAYDGIDFLLKPFDFGRFLQAVNKAGFLISKSNGYDMSGPSTNRYIFVKSDYKLVKINVDDILYIEGLKDYIKIYTRKKLILTLMSMSGIELKLPGEEFFRVHRSYIISLGNIDFISRHRIVIGEKFIPISLPYREKFYTVIEKSL